MSQPPSRAMSQAGHGKTDMRVKRLRWICRRGMKELDVLLERFLENQSFELQQGSWPELENFLEMEDDQIWDFVQNPSLASAEYQQLLKSISRGPAKPA